MLVPIKKKSRVAKGTSKQVYDSEESMFDFILPKGKTESDVLIVTYNRDVNPKEIYEEIALYNKFGNLDISPKIYFVRIQNSNEFQIFSINDYIKIFDPNLKSKIKINSGVYFSYLVDKNICDKDMIKHYTQNKTFDYKQFFSDLRIIATKLVDNGYINTDIKPPNLCIHNNEIKLIDFDDKFMKKINETIDKTHFVEYMVFQVYAWLRTYSQAQFKNLDLKEVIGVDKDTILIMLDNMRNYDVKSEFNPLRMLMHYSNNKEVFEFFNGDYKVYKGNENSLFKLGTSEMWYDIIINTNIPGKLNVLNNELVERSKREKLGKQMSESKSPEAPVETKHDAPVETKHDAPVETKHQATPSPEATFEINHDAPIEPNPSEVAIEPKMSEPKSEAYVETKSPETNHDNSLKGGKRKYQTQHKKIKGQRKSRKSKRQRK